MQNQEFMSEVQRRIRAASDTKNTNAVRAVLQTLTDHLAGNAPAKLAAQLPEEIGAIITEHKSDPAANGEGFGVEEFVRRTAERAGTEDLSAAKNQAIAVLGALRAAISEGEFNKIRGTLPPEYDELFGSDSFASA